MTTYEPGTVAVATVRGVPNVRVMRRRITFGLDDWAFETTAGDIEYSCTSSEAEVTDVRPLVVLDIAPERLSLIRDLIECAREGGVQVGVGTDLDELADLLVDQIEAQTKPPRIPEPGLWGVVEAGHEHLEGRRSKFVRVAITGTAQWVEHEAEADWSTWERLIDPTLVRPGIEDAS